MNKILNTEREKVYNIYFGREHILTLTVNAYNPVTKANALISINRFLEDEEIEQIPFTRWNILKTHVKRVA